MPRINTTERTYMTVLHSREDARVSLDETERLSVLMPDDRDRSVEKPEGGQHDEEPNEPS